jgi:protein TonB
MVDLKPLPEVHTPPPPAARQDLPKSAPIELPPVITAPPAVVTVAAPPAISAPPPAPPVAIVAAPAPQAAVAVPVSAPSAEVGDFGNESPKYPQMSLRLREQGVVRLRVVIDSAGLVRDISVAQGSGFSRLDRAALDGIRKWRFHPGMANGRPLDGAIGFLNYVFALRG